ncbi:hypothetical protein GF373_07785 [bacterium]|nr:hypothetical protein [bacterium]
MNRQSYLHFSLLTLLITGFFAAPICHAVGGKNDSAKFFLDFKVTTDDSQTSSTIDTFTPDVIQEINGENYLTLTLVLSPVTDLVGVNCDLKFDNTKLQVVNIHEDQGDINFDGRANIADILTLSERFGASTTENGFSYFDRNKEGESAETIDQGDIDVIKPYINQKNIFWTSNPNTNISSIRESVEIFESPEESNADGTIDDIVAVLLSRVHPYEEGFGFGDSADARIAEITFKVIGSGDAVFSFEDGRAIDVDTVITQDGITNGSEPTGDAITISLP